MQPLNSEFTQDSAQSHYHQCGRTRLGLDPDLGCGHLWSHSVHLPNGPGVSKQSLTVAFCSAHHCPRCSRGPFYYALSIEEVESANSAVKA